MTKTPEMISDKVIPYPPYGRLLVQKFSDGKMFEVVVTGTDNDGKVIDEISGSVKIETLSSSSLQTSELIPSVKNHCEADAVTILENTLEQNVMKILESNNN